MKAFRFKKHRMDNVKIKVFVVSDDEDAIIPVGCKFDVPPPRPLNKPKLILKLFTRVKKPNHQGRVELTFSELI